jgi:uncharacterized protein (DUF2126 family)
MSCAQQLLMRALVARFWKEPCRAPLVRWGTQIHDRWMLPHFIWEDFRDVLRELREFGFDLRDEWFAPHLEFRFPKIGDAQHAGIHVEVRTAIEPWLVLGEEATAFGPARYVDSSVERVQVKASGLTDSRHVLTVGGRRLPLQPTGVKGEGVCGVRYRAWQPPSCLHPTIGIHSPLVIDVHDTWSGRSIGGCTYHVVHPGGRGYETFPINAAEAETRRATRFFPNGHTPGPWTIGPEEPNPEYPCTLDLRR